MYFECTGVGHQIRMWHPPRKRRCCTNRRRVRVLPRAICSLPCHSSKSHCQIHNDRRFCPYSFKPKRSCTFFFLQRSEWKFSRKLTRPSLSEQLRSIASNSEKITQFVFFFEKKVSIRTNRGLRQSFVVAEKISQPALMSFYCSSFIVGTLKRYFFFTTVWPRPRFSQFPSPLQFYPNFCTYAFHHPTAQRIDMEMWYQHMSKTSLDDTKRQFSFKINRLLGIFHEHCWFLHRFCCSVLLLLLPTWKSESSALHSVRFPVWLAEVSTYVYFHFQTPFI